MPSTANRPTPDAKVLDLGLRLHEMLTREEQAIASHDLDAFAELAARRRRSMEEWRARLGSLGDKVRHVAEALDARLRVMAADNDERARRALELQAEALLTVLDGHRERADTTIHWTTHAIERDLNPMAA